MVGNGAEAEKASGSGAGSIAGSGGEAGGRVEEEGGRRRRRGASPSRRRRAGDVRAVPWRGWQVGHGGTAGTGKRGGGNDLIRLDFESK